jgi:microcystin-dependent protein
VVLSNGEMPIHTHSNLPHGHNTIPHAHITPGAILTPGEIGPGVPFTYATALTISTQPATVDVIATTITIESSGQGDSHENMPPFITLNYAIVAI